VAKSAPAELAILTGHMGFASVAGPPRPLPRRGTPCSSVDRHQTRGSRVGAGPSTLVINLVAGMVEHRPSGWIGAVLQGKWRIEAKIARGGVATVFRATHRRGQVAAIKIMHPELAQNADVRSRFLREGYAANKVGHPGVVRVLDDDVTSDGTAYIVMELLEHGEELEDMRERSGGFLPVQDVARICDQVLEVLAAAHEQGIIHRDIKPENIFVLEGGSVKVLDFGIAHIKEAAAASGERTATGLLLGTPEYMAPEQALGKRGQIDAHTDVYAVGATMFTLLSGEAVHVQDTLSALLMATSTRQARTLASTRVGKTIPREVIAIVDKALALEKHRRWRSASEMRDALRKAVPQEVPSRPSLAPPATTPQSGAKAETAPPPADAAPPQKAISLKPPPMQKLQRIPLPSAPPPGPGTTAPRALVKIPAPSAVPGATSRAGVKVPAPGVPAIPPGAGVKMHAPPAITPGSGVKVPTSPPPRASRPPPAPLAARPVANKPPASLAPSSEPKSDPPPPSSGRTSVVGAPSPSHSERTVVRPPRAAPAADFRAPIDGSLESASLPTPYDANDPWTAEFTDGDMEGPTVSTTESPALRSLPPLPRSVAQSAEATHALPAPPIARAASSIAATPGPAFVAEDTRRTVRLDRPGTDGAVDPRQLTPFAPFHFEREGGGSILPPPPRRAERDAISRTAPVLSSVDAHMREAAGPMARGQAGWLPHQVSPRLPPPEATKPQAIRLAELALAALVVITLSIGGCILLRHR